MALLYGKYPRGKWLSTKIGATSNIKSSLNGEVSCRIQPEEEKKNLPKMYHRKYSFKIILFFPQAGLCLLTLETPGGTPELARWISGK